jgi:exosortase
VGRAAAQLGVALIAALLGWPIVAHAIEAWSTNEELTFGFFVVPVALLLIWRRRNVVSHTNSHGTPAGLLIVVVALAALLVCERVAARSPAACAYGLLLWGISVWLWGWPVGRVLAFPISFATFGLALQQTLISPLAFWLQQVTAAAAAAVTPVLGVPIISEGLVLRGNGFAFVVAEACSGMSSLLVLLALSALWLHLFQGTVWARVAVLMSVLPFVVAANTMRVVLVLLVAAAFGQDAALGFFHGASSLVLFGLALAGLLLVTRAVKCRVPVVT